jgi:hypothetical protein
VHFIWFVNLFHIVAQSKVINVTIISDSQMLLFVFSFKYYCLFSVSNIIVCLIVNCLSLEDS